MPTPGNRWTSIDYRVALIISSLGPPNRMSEQPHISITTNSDGSRRWPGPPSCGCHPTVDPAGSPGIPRPRPVAAHVRQRCAGVPARADFDDLRVLLAARSRQIPFSLQLVLPRGPQHVQSVPAELAAQFADAELAGDLRAGVPGGDQAQQLPLPGSAEAQGRGAVRRPGRPGAGAGAAAPAAPGHARRNPGRARGKGQPDGPPGSGI